jgi:GH18 family chitinase
MHNNLRHDLTMYFNGVYYPNWRVYRDQPPSTLNYNVISHVFYAFAWYASLTLVIPIPKLIGL